MLNKQKKTPILFSVYGYTWSKSMKACLRETLVTFQGRNQHFKYNGIIVSISYLKSKGNEATFKICLRDT